MKILSGLDARFLASETATAHMHTIKVVVVDTAHRVEPLSAEALPHLIEERLPRMPVLRRRIVPMPMRLSNPAVIDDPDFDLTRHLGHVTADPPGGQQELDRVVAGIAGVSLLRDRPLWELSVVDGLAGQRTAFVMKLHHALADGVASVALLENAFILDEADAIIEEFRPEPLPGSGALLRASASSAARAARTFPSVVRRTAAGTRRARAARRREPTRPPGPFAGPRSPFNVALSPDRTFATLRLPIATLAAAKERCGATLNEAFLALCGGGTRRYLQRLGALPRTSLVASVPMATRTDRHRLDGNHVDNLYLPLRTDLADPLERIRSVHELAGAARRIRTALGPELFEARSGLVPSGIHGLLPRLWAATTLANHVRPPLNLVVSCVRGPRRRLELADGSVVDALFSCGPILEGIGLNITAWTYGDDLHVSVLGCAASLPDPWQLSCDLEAELAQWKDRW